MQMTLWKPNEGAGLSVVLRVSKRSTISNESLPCSFTLRRLKRLASSLSSKLANRPRDKIDVLQKTVHD